MKKVCCHFYVQGRVRGVWFRASTQDEAKSRGLTGWVQNLADGRVEVLACGPQEVVRDFETWLRRGPEKAEVEELSVEEIPWEDHTTFEVKY